MKILLISYYHLDEESSGSLRGRAIAKYLPLNGIDVTVLTANHQKKDLMISGNVISIKDINHYSKTFLGYAWRASQKLLRLMGFYRGIHAYWLSKAISNSKKIIELSKPQIVVASYPCIEALEIGIRLSKEYGIPLVLDFRDGLMFESLETQLLRKTSFQNHYAGVEKIAIETATSVVSISEPISNYFSYKYKCSNSFTLPNGYDDEEVHELRDYPWDENLTHIVHTGRISSSRATGEIGLLALINALTILRKSSPESIHKLKIHFVGNLNPKERAALSIFDDLGIVNLWGQLPRSIALGFQRKADCLLLITAPDQTSVATGKIFEYLASKKFILALTSGTEAEKIILSTGAGVAIHPNNPDKIAEYLLMIISRKPHDCIRNQQVINSYSRAAQMKTLSLHLTQIVK